MELYTDYGKARTNEGEACTWGISLEELFAAYLKTYAFAPHRLEIIVSSLEIFRKIRIFLLSELTEATIIAWRNDVLQRASAVAWNHYSTHLRALLNYALKKGWIKDNFSCLFLKAST